VRQSIKLTLITLVASSVCFAVVPGGNVCPQAKPDGGGISGFPNNAYEANVPTQGTCNLSIVVTNGSTSITIANTVPYDGDEDQLIGVTNNSTGVITSIIVSNPGASPAIFAFETDGICAYQPFTSNSQPCNGAAPGASNYGGNASSYTGINGAQDTGTINFSPGIPAGGTGYFSLEGPASASVTILFPVMLTKAFSPNPIVAPGNSTLTFTISNPNAAAAIDVAFSDSLPPGLAVAASPNLSTTCPGPPITGGATSGSTSLNVFLPSLGAGASCTVSVSVHTDIAGTYNNLTSTITATGLPTGSPATASLGALVPVPTFTKAFSPTLIGVGDVSTLTFSIRNNDGVPIVGLAFTDTLPAGVIVATPNGLTDTCGGGVTATAGSNVIMLLNGVVNAPINVTCTISVNVVGTIPGILTNTTSPLTSANAPTAQPATAILTVALPPTISKAFADSELQLFGPSSTTALTFDISNPNSAITLPDVSFTDTLPGGLIVATPNGLTGSCDGGTITAVAGSNMISLSGAALAGGASCTFSVNVTAIAIGVQINTTSAITAAGGTIVGLPATATTSVDDKFFLWFFSDGGGGHP
jgi:uncharacterized repeat protein (TIGR01451 family)